MPVLLVFLSLHDVHGNQEVNCQTAGVEVTLKIFVTVNCTIPPKKGVVKGGRARWILSFVLEFKVQ